MVNKALEVMKNSYSPYSNFRVGAAVLLKNGEIITGTNIENASYGLSMCAERVALFTTYARGYKRDDIVSMTIAGKFLTMPCGACRQVMIELMNPNSKVILVDELENTKEYLLSELIPYAFEMRVK